LGSATTGAATEGASTLGNATETAFFFSAVLAINVDDDDDADAGSDLDSLTLLAVLGVDFVFTVELPADLTAGGGDVD